MDAMKIYVALANVVVFFMYGVDKWNAKHGLRRIPEKTLLGIAVAGGSIGAYIGMQLFRHKIRKPRFYIGIPVILAVQVVLLLYIYH